MIDRLNDGINFLNKRKTRLQSDESKVLKNHPEGLNATLWEKYGNDYAVATHNIKYLYYQHGNMPRPLKSKR